MTRPSEAITATVGSIVGAAVILLASFTDWQPSTEVVGAVVVLVSWVAAGVTYFVAKRQAAGSLSSGPTGQVLKG